MIDPTSAAPVTCRCFIAAPVPPQMKADLARLQERLASRLDQVRWVRPDSLHITLRFLGDQAEDSLEKLGHSMLSVGGLNAAFKVCCHGIGAYPSTRRARVILAGFKPDSRWVTLHQTLTQQLETCGIPPEQRPFTPHLTLGRVRRRPLDLSLPLKPFADFGCGSLTIDRIILYQSQLQPGGAIHMPYRTARLTGSDVSCHTTRPN